MGFDDCDLVLEAVVEQMDVKQQVFAEFSEAAPNAILAEHVLALGRRDGPDVDLHFFNPVR